MKYNCTHERATRLFKIGNATLWGGSRDDLLARPGWALVISAVGTAEFEKSPLSAPADVRALFPAASKLFVWEPPPCLGIDWPDRGTPRLTRAWWRELAKTLPEVSGDVGLCCFGGHGRTGTALAILATLSGKVKKGDCPVAWVRKRYCEAVVESNAQLDYIEHVTERKVPSSAASFSTAMPQAWPMPEPTVAAGAANPHQATPQLLPVTGAGSKTGEVGSTETPTDSELIALWFKSNEDYVTVDGVRYTPVWDIYDDEIVGWKTG